MSIAREVAIQSMNATNALSAKNFLVAAGVHAPVPTVSGALPTHAQEPFYARDIKQLFDLLVIFTIGDFPSSLACSNYFNPNSPWYNVFYGAYGVYSHKPGGVPWGFDATGAARFDEISQIPALDYNFLTAGELGCPPDRMCFEVTGHTVGAEKGWASADVFATIPSGLHSAHDAVHPNLTYYAVFGAPEKSFLVGGRPSYEPVKMHGKMFWRAVAPRTTLVFGGMTPATAQGDQLLAAIVESMKPLYMT